MALSNGVNGQTIISNIDFWGLAKDNNGYLYVSDCKKHEVRRWHAGDTAGVLVAGGNGQGNRLDQLDGPTYLFVDQDHSIYVSDTSNHRVMRWANGSIQSSIVVCRYGKGDYPKHLNSPVGLTFDRPGNLYVIDHGNNRAQKFHINLS